MSRRFPPGRQFVHGGRAGDIEFLGRFQRTPQHPFRLPDVSRFQQGQGVVHTAAEGVVHLTQDVNIVDCFTVRIARLPHPFGSILSYLAGFVNIEYDLVLSSKKRGDAHEQYEAFKSESQPDSGRRNR